MDKKEKILDALQALFEEGRGGAASVSEIAKKAGIAKGGMYYYFRSKEEVLDALVERQYQNIIRECEAFIREDSGNALKRLALLVEKYRSLTRASALDECLHAPQNAAIHQKSLAKITEALSPIVSSLIEQGIDEGLFSCSYPQEYAEIILSVFTYLLDPGIFHWTLLQQLNKMKALADLIEKGLSAPEHSFDFLYASASLKY